MVYESVKAHDGTDIRVARFEPTGKPIGVVQIIHGFGEGIAHYVATAEFFAKNGFACIVHDQRGFGEMPHLSQKAKQKARGVVPGYEYFLEDIRTLHTIINVWYPTVPKILYGHSMGGNITINYLLKNGGYDKAILESPWLRLYKPLPRFAASLAGQIGRLSSNLTINAKVEIDHISRDQDIRTSRRTDGIYHMRMSLRLYAEVVKAGENAIRNADKLLLPTLLLCPGADKIVCPEAIREFSEGSGENVVFIEYPDGYHCLHADTISAEVLNAMLEFCMG